MGVVNQHKRRSSCGKAGNDDHEGRRKFNVILRMC